MKKKILFFLNPKSNDGYSIWSWKSAREKYSVLPKDPIDITKVENLSKFIKEDNPEIVAIAGGDGTINSVCTAVYKLKKKPLLTILPFGRGNALSYCFGIETADKAIDVLFKQPKMVDIDIMKTSDKNYPFGIFNISAGFDARVIHNRMYNKYIGFKSYVLSSIRSVLRHQEQQIRFTIDHGVTLRATASSIVVAKSPIIPLLNFLPFIDKDYVISQDAKLNDGFLDCTLFSSKYAYMSNLRLKGFKHPLYSEMGKVHFKARHIKIEGEPYVQVDGDPILQKGELEIEIVPQALSFLRNTDRAIDKNYLPFIVNE